MNNDQMKLKLLEFGEIVGTYFIYNRAVRTFWTRMLLLFI